MWNIIVLKGEFNIQLWKKILLFGWLSAVYTFFKIFKLEFYIVTRLEEVEPNVSFWSFKIIY
jgi:hypothetical protein